MDTYAIVLEELQKASSQDPQVLKPAEARLRDWETQSGFYTVLNNVIANQQLDVGVRWMAVLYMKNGIDRYWRKNAPNGISDVEKHQIRLNLLCNFGEPINQIAVQRAVLISKVARWDCPKEWPELLPALIQGVEDVDSLIQHRALLTLHHVIKAISSKRLAGDKRQFQDFTNNIFMYILNLWNVLTEAFIRDIMNNSNVESITMNLEKALLTLRILRKLSVFGFYKPHLNQDCMSFLKVIFEKVKTVLQCHKVIRGMPGYPVSQCEKFIIHLTKVLLSMLDMHPFSFIDLISSSLELAVYYLFTEEGVSFLFERFIVQCFNLIKNILLCAEYKAAKIPELTKNPDTLNAFQIRQAFFQPQLVSDMCRKLVGHYFILTQEELEMWDNDPEAFSIEDCGDSWRYSLRPSMETVFVTIFKEYREILTPVLLEMVSETHVLIPPENMQQILRKDAVYNAVGLCAFDLYDEVDFDQWFTNTLVQELKIKHNNYRVIRRRVSTLIGRWTGIKLSSELRPLLYECIIDLLGQNEDMAVRLTAASTLRSAIDDFEFDCDQFQEYLMPTFDALFALLQEAAECETKMQVLTVLTLALERGGGLTAAEALAQRLPELWRSAEQHPPLRCAVAAALREAVRAAGGARPSLRPLLLEVVRAGTDLGNPDAVYLLEDALDLWATLLEYAAAMDEELANLFDVMPGLLDYSTENLWQCLYVCTTHILLAPEAVLTGTQGVRLMSACAALMPDLKDEAVLAIVRLAETALKASPSAGAEATLPVAARAIVRLLESNTQDMEPAIAGGLLSLAARLLLSSRSHFERALEQVSGGGSPFPNAASALSRLLDVWIARTASLTRPEYRKLLALAAAALLASGVSPALSHAAPLFRSCLEALHDVADADGAGDSLLLGAGDSPSRFDEEGGRYETEHDVRKRQLIAADPVHSVELRGWVAGQVAAMRVRFGAEGYARVAEGVDADIRAQYAEYYGIEV